ncbi:MAG: hypothetical protein ABID04_02250 [Patescibacteria group bacterium]
MSESGNPQSIAPITPEEIKRARQQDPVAPIVLQHGGVVLLDKNSQPLPATINPEKLAGLSTSSSEKQKAELWVTPEMARDYPKLEVGDPERLLETGGLTELLPTMRQIVQEWAEQDPTKKRVPLLELLKADHQGHGALVFQACLSLEKIEILLSIGKLNERLKESLRVIKAFYQDELIPSLEVDSKEMEKARQAAVAILEKPKGPQRKQETYRQKAERVLVMGKKRKKNWYTGQKKYQSPERTVSKFHGSTRQDVQRMPARLSDELLKTAVQVNLIRTLQRLESDGLDFVTIRQTVQKLLSSLPERSATETKLSPKEIDWLGKLNEQLAPIANAVTKAFPHDTVSLYSQMLEHKQAICAGKATVLTDVYKIMGLDARYTAILISANSRFKGEHSVCQIQLPTGLVLEVDANWSPQKTQNTAGLGQYSVFAGVLIPTQEYPDDEAFKKIIDDRGHPDKIRIEGGRRRIYKAVGSAHRLISPSPEGFIYEKVPLAILIESHPELFVGVYGKTEDEVRQHAGRLHQEAIDINPNEVNAPYNLGFLIANNLDLFASNPEEKKRQLLRAKALLEKHNKIINSPDDGWVKRAQNKIDRINEQLDDLPI